MADQYAGVDAFGMPYDENYHISQDYEEYNNEPTTITSHQYSDTVQDLDFQVDGDHDRRYSAVDFDTTQYMNGYDQYNNQYNDGYNHEQIEKPPDASYAEYAARQKIAQLATIARRHEELLKQQQQAIAEENKRDELNVYQKVERPTSRKQWICGTHVLVQRDKSTQWFHGTIVNIYYNAMGLFFVYILSIILALRNVMENSK